MALLAGMALLTLAAARLAGGLLIAGEESVLRNISRGRIVGVDELLGARRNYEAALSWHGNGREWADLGRLDLHLAIAPGTGDAAARALLEAAAKAFREAVRRAPADSFAWAGLSEVELLLNGPGPPFQAAYERSIATGPAEPALSKFRLRVGLAHWPELAPEARAAMVRQVQVAAQIAPGVLASEAATPLLRDLVASILADRPDLYGRFVAATATEG